MGHGLMGLNNIPLEGGNKSQFSCVFVDPSGLMNEISVPFHFALRYVFIFLLFGLSYLNFSHVGIS
jgi:hypothetical protein